MVLYPTFRTSNNLRLSDYGTHAMPAVDMDAQELQAPWVKKMSGKLPSINRELHDYMVYVAPSLEERARRRDVVRRFSALISSINSAYSVRPVGSYVTGLYSDSSDIDMVLTGTTSEFAPVLSLRELMNKIKASGFASNVEDILHARVPLIRLTDNLTSIDIDLTESYLHSMRATAAVQKWIKGETEIKRMLITVVKKFLAIRRCGTTYTGGINSYVLVWMVVAWVEIEWPKLKSSVPAATEPQHALDAGQPDGVADLAASMAKLSTGSKLQQSAGQGYISQYRRALRHFFKFYGTTFQYETQAIEIEPTPRFKRKAINFARPHLLSIYDPAGAEDMGAKVFGIKHIQATFANAYKRILAASLKEGLSEDQRRSAYPKGVLYNLFYE